MNTIRNGKELLLILPDNTALSFKPAHRGADPDYATPATAGSDVTERLKRFFKSLTPKIRRTFPVETQLPSGERLSLMRPAMMPGE